MAQEPSAATSDVLLRWLGITIFIEKTPMKHLFLFQILLFTVKISTSQSYTPMLDNTEWIVRVTNFWYDESFWILRTTDTTIGSYTYNRYVDSASSNSLVLLREDVANKKVYKYEPFYGGDFLLYDFSLGINGTIARPGGMIYYVTQIDSIPIATGGKTRGFSLSSNPGSQFGKTEYWIEGVGNASHPLYGQFQLLSDPTYSTTCNYHNGVNYYNSGLHYGGNPSPCPYSLTGVPKSLNHVIALNASPNPFTETTTITTDIPLINAEMKIYNHLGECLKTFTNVTGTSIDISLSDIQAGMYFLCVNQKNKPLAIKKLVKYS